MIYLVIFDISDLLFRRFRFGFRIRAMIRALQNPDLDARFVRKKKSAKLHDFPRVVAHDKSITERSPGFPSPLRRLPHFGQEYLVSLPHEIPMQILREIRFVAVYL
jgi:hypothetical protein